MKRNRELAGVPCCSGPGRVQFFDHDFARSTLSPDFDSAQVEVATLPGAHGTRTPAGRCANK